MISRRGDPSTGASPAFILITETMAKSPADTAVSSSSSLLDAVKPDGLTRAAPSLAGLDADAVVGFLNDVEAAGLDLHAFMLHVDGRVVAEAWRWPYRADRPRNLHSVAKSFTACAIGLALEEGRFHLHDKVVSFLPEALHGPIDARLAEMTVEDLLTMRTGHACQTSGATWRGIDTSWIAEFFKIPLVHQPGTTFVYTSAASYMLSAILSRATGETLHDYLKPRILEPLGIEGETWDIGPDGINPGGNGLVATTADMLKLGILHAQDGVWEGKRLLPKAWVDAATRPQGESGRYGYHWWTRPDGSYSAIGVFVQMVTVFPTHGATLAVTGAIKGSAQLQPHIARYFPVAFDGSRANAAADERLGIKLAQWQRPDTPASWKTAYAHAPLPLETQTVPLAGIRTARFAMEPNVHGILELQLEFTDGECTFQLTDAYGKHVVVAGFGQWLESRSDVPGSHLHHGYRLRNGPVVARACWLDNTRLQMT
jgi:CubicO group peptidase (beta-lactamase class C family)